MTSRPDSRTAERVRVRRFSVCSEDQVGTSIRSLWEDTLAKVGDGLYPVQAIVHEPEDLRRVMLGANMPVPEIERLEGLVPGIPEARFVELVMDAPLALIEGRDDAYLAGSAGRIQ